MDANQVIAELASSGQIIHDLVQGISQAEAQIQPKPDAWSVLEVMCHMLDEEKEDFRQKLDFTLNRPGETWPEIDPAGWVTSRSYNNRNLAEIVAGFKTERERSLAWLKSLQNPDWDTIHKSQFGIMKAGDLLAAWVAHDNLHVRQLVELRRGRVLHLTEPYNVGYAGEW